MPKNLRLNTFSDPVCHFGAPRRPFWILQALQRCRRWASAPFAARLVFLDEFPLSHISYPLFCWKILNMMVKIVLYFITAAAKSWTKYKQQSNLYKQIQGFLLSKPKRTHNSAEPKIDWVRHKFLWQTPPPTTSQSQCQQYPNCYWPDSI